MVESSDFYECKGLGAGTPKAKKAAVAVSPPTLNTYNLEPRQLQLLFRSLRKKSTLGIPDVSFLCRSP